MASDFRSHLSLVLQGPVLSAALTALIDRALTLPEDNRPDAVRVMEEMMRRPDVAAAKKVDMLKVVQTLTCPPARTDTKAATRLSYARLFAPNLPLMVDEALRAGGDRTLVTASVRRMVETAPLPQHTSSELCLRLGLPTARTAPAAVHPYRPAAYTHTPRQPRRERPRGGPVRDRGGLEVVWAEAGVGWEFLGVSDNIDDESDRIEEVARGLQGFLFFVVRERDRAEQAVQDRAGRAVPPSEEMRFLAVPEADFSHIDTENRAAVYRFAEPFRFRERLSLMLTAKGAAASILPPDPSLGTDAERPLLRTEVDAAEAAEVEPGYFIPQDQARAREGVRLVPETAGLSPDLAVIRVTSSEPFPVYLRLYGRRLLDFSQVSQSGVLFPVTSSRRETL